MGDWEAYERIAGPIGTQYTNELLAEIADGIRELIWLTGAAQWGKENPIEYPKEKVPKPSQYHEWKKRQAEQRSSRVIDDGDFDSEINK